MAVGLLALPAALLGSAGACLAAAIASAALAAVVLRRPLPWGSPVLAAGAVAVASLAVDLAYTGPKGPVQLWLPWEFAALLVLLARVVRRASARWVAVAGAVLGLAAAGLPLRLTLWLPKAVLVPSVVGVAAAALPTACALGTGLYLRAQDGRRARAVRRARREQRLEVARDLHDFVAHEVTGILLEVQAAQVAGYDEREVAELLGRLEGAGLRALDSMDRTLRTLRDPEAPEAVEPPPTRVHGLADLPELVERFLASSAAGGALALEPGVAGRAPKEVEDAAYRVVLEALTNVRRHAPGTGRVEVGVGIEASLLRVTVTDRGRGAGAPAPRGGDGGGTGLAALAERVEALGGRLEAGPYGGGWRVCAELGPVR
ncbi:sensor histidine kinase [Kitasatospora sp. NPDC101183]|uniref:sensor histidine kinase n=1 Tax=Kitasatospora sp. NPDC101183 TaxID=3364100 RepID=UPI0038195350